MKILTFISTLVVVCFATQFSAGSKNSIVSQQYYSIGNVINLDNIININNAPSEIGVKLINNDEELGSLFCNDVWRTFDGPINGSILGKVCVVNNAYYCQNTYYKSSDIVGTGLCVSDPV